MATTIGRQAPRSGVSGRAWDEHKACDLGVERGPDWLFVRLERLGAGPRGGLAETVWDTIQEHGATRVVLELDRVETVSDALRGAVAEIGTRLRDAGGLIRICGLSESALSTLQSLPAAAAVPHFRSRAEAVGTRPTGTGSCE